MLTEKACSAIVKKKNRRKKGKKRGRKEAKGGDKLQADKKVGMDKII